jgi:hypothetical protein
MAYVLGFIVADGTLTPTRRGGYYIEITSTDRDILHSIRNSFESDICIGEYQPKRFKSKRRYRLQFGSKEMFMDLQQLGLTPNKSMTVRLPPVPSDYFSSFMRGYFDGDGCVNVCTYQKKGHKGLSTVISSGFTSGSKYLLLDIRHRLLSLGIVNGGTFYYNRAYRLWFSIKDSERLYKYMYQDISGGLYLPRKKAIFERYFQG